MADTGDKAGQAKEFAFQLLQNGAALAYANATAFEAAGWALDLRVAEAQQTFTYTLIPHPDTTLAAQGWHVVKTTMVNGHGMLLVQIPTTGTGWQVAPAGYGLTHETVDLDDLYSQLLSGAGVTLASTTIVSSNFDIIEGQSFTGQVVALLSALTAFGFDNDDLLDGTLVLSGMVRLPDNATGIPNAYLAVSVDSASGANNPVLRISLPRYPLTAVASLTEGMAIVSADPNPSSARFLYDVQAVGSKTLAVSAVGTGPGGTFTFASDQRRWFAIGQSFTITGSTNNNATWTVAGVSYNGTNTIVTVIAGQTVGAVADGTAAIPVEIVLVKGTINVSRQETRAP